METTAIIHPGEILLEEFLEPLAISQNKLAIAMAVPASTVNAIVKGDRNITAPIAMRLALALGTSPEFWLNLQKRYEMDRARLEFGERIEAEVRPLVTA